MINFTDAGESPRGFIMGALLDQAQKCKEEYQTALAFALLWMSFNAWGSLVTGEDTDREMIIQLGREQRLKQAFQMLFSSDNAFKQAVCDFAKYWPIFSNSDIGLHNEWANMQTFYQSRADTKNHLMRFPNKKASRQADRSVTGGIRRRPSNDHFNPNMPTWEETLETLYMVRNNLMHGTKGFDGDDPEIIRASYETLHSFIRGHNLYAWDGVGIIA
jgi:hypothetical protein